MIKINNEEITTWIFKNEEIEEGWYDKELVYKATTFVAKPTLASTSLTFNNATQSVIESGYNEIAMTRSSTSVMSAINSGTYSITYALNKGFAWADDESEEPYTITWTMNKKAVRQPTLQNASHTYVGAACNSNPSYDTSYSAIGSGSTTTSSSTGTFHVYFYLLFPNDTYWEGTSSNANIDRSWSVNWVNGQSHYSNDLLNGNWSSGVSLIQNTQNQSSGTWGGSWWSNGLWFYCTKGRATSGSGATYIQIQPNSNNRTYYFQYDNLARNTTECNYTQPIYVYSSTSSGGMMTSGTVTSYGTFSNSSGNATGTGSRTYLKMGFNCTSTDRSGQCRVYRIYYQ